MTVDTRNHQLITPPSAYSRKTPIISLPLSLSLSFSVTLVFALFSPPSLRSSIASLEKEAKRRQTAGTYLSYAAETGSVSRRGRSSSRRRRRRLVQSLCCCCCWLFFYHRPRALCVPYPNPAFDSLVI